MKEFNPYSMTDYLESTKIKREYLGPLDFKEKHNYIFNNSYFILLNEPYFKAGIYKIKTIKENKKSKSLNLFNDNKKYMIVKTNQKQNKYKMHKTKLLKKHHKKFSFNNINDPIITDLSSKKTINPLTIKYAKDDMMTKTNYKNFITFQCLDNSKLTNSPAVKRKKSMIMINNTFQSIFNKKLKPNVTSKESSSISSVHLTNNDNEKNIKPIKLLKFNENKNSENKNSENKNTITGTFRKTSNSVRRNSKKGSIRNTFKNNNTTAIKLNIPKNIFSVSKKKPIKYEQTQQYLNELKKQELDYIKLHQKRLCSQGKKYTDFNYVMKDYLLKHHHKDYLSMDADSDFVNKINIFESSKRALPLMKLIINTVEKCDIENEKLKMKISNNYPKNDLDIQDMRFELKEKREMFLKNKEKINRINNLDINEISSRSKIKLKSYTHSNFYRKNNSCKKEKNNIKEYANKTNYNKACEKRKNIDLNDEDVNLYDELTKMFNRNMKINRKLYKLRKKILSV